MVVIVDCDSVEGIIHAKVLGAVFDVEKFLGALIGGHTPPSQELCAVWFCWMVRQAMGPSQQ